MKTFNKFSKKLILISAVLSVMAINGYAEGTATRAMSQQQAKDILKTLEPNLNTAELLGAWKRVLSVPITNDNSALNGEQNSEGLKNLADDSQNLLTFSTQTSDWLPTGESAELRVREDNILLKDSSFETRLSISGNMIEYRRPERRLWASYIRPKLFSSDRWLAQSECETRKPRGMSFSTENIAGELRVEQCSHYDFSYHMENIITVQCGLLFNNHDRLVCTLQNNDNSSAIVGFSRVKN